MTVKGTKKGQSCGRHLGVSRGIDNTKRACELADQKSPTGIQSWLGTAGVERCARQLAQFCALCVQLAGFAARIVFGCCLLNAGEKQNSYRTGVHAIVFFGAIDSFLDKNGKRVLLRSPTSEKLSSEGSLDFPYFPRKHL